MRILFKMIRFVRHAKRRLLGVHPSHWVEGFLIPVKIVAKIALQVIELFPTVGIILTAPIHFFDRLPCQTLPRKSGLKPIYRSPVGFAVQVALLMVATLGIDKHLSYVNQIRFNAEILLGVVLIIVLIPLTIPILCLVLIPIHTCFRALAIGLKFLPRYTFLETSLWLRLPLDFRSYSRLSPARYFWGLFYFFGYLASAGCWLALLTIVIYLFLVLFVVPNPAHGNTYLFAKSMLVFGLLLTAGIARVVVYPYSALLISASKTPTLLMRRVLFWEIELTVANLLGAAPAPYKTCVRKGPGQSKLGVALTDFRTAVSMSFVAFANARKQYAHVRRVHHLEALENGLGLRKLLGHLKWDELALTFSTLPFPEDSRRSAMDQLARIDADLASEVDQRIERSRIAAVGDLAKCLDDAFDFLGRVQDPACKHRSRYVQSIVRILSRDILCAWSRVSPGWSVLKCTIQADKLAALQAGLKDTGLDDKCVKGFQIIGKMKSIAETRSEQVEDAC
jgi:hypothetical protein